MSSKWKCILCDIMIFVCWELDSLGRGVRGLAVNGTVYCGDIMNFLCWELDSLGRRLWG